MNEWLLIMLMAAVTFIPRYLPFAMAGKLRISAGLEQALAFVPIAVLTAIITQTALIRNGSIDVSFHNYHALATLAAFVAAVWTRHLFLTIATGLIVFALLRLLA
jgi:branched-subunit amino acid transport protein